uniref:CCHC-type domain-containing protein n=1 Tax=Oreochromis niloticus TaxID=8128 RepID=A0A669D9H5_ORENI
MSVNWSRENFKCWKFSENTSTGRGLNRGRNKRGEGPRGFRWERDRRKEKCYACRERGHYAREDKIYIVDGKIIGNRFCVY